MKFCFLILFFSATVLGKVELKYGESTSDGAVTPVFEAPVEYVAQHMLGSASCGPCQEERNRVTSRLNSTVGTFRSGDSLSSKETQK